MPSQQSLTQRQEASCLPEECDDCRQILASQGQTTMRLFKHALARRSKSSQAVPKYRASKTPSTISIRSVESKDLPSPDDSDDMSSLTTSPGSRPQSSQGLDSTSRERPSPRRPTLKQIMANEAEAPWTLAAFTQYASQNMCLENIEFIQDAYKYRQEYLSKVEQVSAASEAATFSSADVDRLRLQWTTLIITYIVPSSPREVNIPGDVRIALASVPATGEPPAPDNLTQAIHKVYELIEGSILLPFFHDTRPQEQLVVPEQAGLEASGAKRRSSPVLDTASVTFAPNTVMRKTKTSPLNFHNLNRPNHNFPGKTASHGHAASSSSSISAVASNNSTHSTSYSSYTAFTDSIDDQGGVLSPTTLASPTNTNEHTSPPTTPPASEYELSQRRPSPRSKSGSSWQKSIGKLFGKNNNGTKKSHRGSESAIEEE